MLSQLIHARTAFVAAAVAKRTSADLMARCFSVSATRPDIMEFFDDKENWGKTVVRVGRSWKKDELRLKSNEDLHKLWYVLLKERNMLLTMEEAHKKAHQNLANPERLDKVDESMEHLEEVVRERNRAYFQLEVGTSGEQERQIIPGPFGVDVGYLQREHVVPWENNSRHRAGFKFRYGTVYGKQVLAFYRRYREKVFRELRRTRLEELRKAAFTLKRFPKTSDEALEEKFPLITASEVKRYDKALSHGRNDHLDAVHVNIKPLYSHKK